MHIRFMQKVQKDIEGGKEWASSSSSKSFLLLSQNAPPILATYSLAASKPVTIWEILRVGINSGVARGVQATPGAAYGVCMWHHYCPKW